MVVWASTLLDCVCSDRDWAQPRWLHSFMVVWASALLGSAYSDRDWARPRWLHSFMVVSASALLGSAYSDRIWARLRGLRRSFVVASALFVSACSDSSSIYLTRPWPADQVAVVVLADASAQPIEGTPRVFLPGERVDFSVSRNGSFRVHVLTYSGSGDVARCAVVFGGAGTPLPAASSVWISPPIDSDTRGEARLEPDASPPVFDLRFSQCMVNDVCDVTVKPIDAAPTYENLAAVVMLSQDLAFFGGHHFGETDASALFGRIDGEETTIFPPRPHELVEEIRGFAFDGTSTVYALTPFGLVLLALDGTVTATIPTAAIGEPTQVTVGAGADPLVRVHDGSVDTFSPESRTFTRRTDVPPHVDRLLDVRPDRIAAMLSDGSISYFDGSSWHRESEPADLSFHGEAGDDDLMIVVPRIGALLLRDEHTKSWREIGRPFEPFPSSAALAGDKRVLVVGEAGAAAMWLGDRWCRIETGTQLNLAAVSSSPDRTRAIAVGSRASPNTPPVILDFTIPPP